MRQSAALPRGHVTSSCRTFSSAAACNTLAMGAARRHTGHTHLHVQSCWCKASCWSPGVVGGCRVGAGSLGWWVGGW